ncbi:MAG TPA: TonB-dependent receptor [Gammaproteobacteria bacterium]|nr:TonB-dependent receptor [Gammaproteobacteria bacterium]
MANNYTMRDGAAAPTHGGNGRERADEGRRALTPALSALAFAVSAALAGPVHAQEQQQQQQIEEVTVTGSRIQRTSGFTTPVPVTAVTVEQLNNYSPNQTIADQLGKLPQFFRTESAQREGGALFGTAGVSSLNLRGMGPERTLVLLNGARVVPADRNGTVDVDNFPTALLRNVEVVTGGASAAYGADAIAGVTNFVLNREFEGLDVSLRGGQTDVGDGQNYKVTVSGGTQIADRWHFVGSVETQRIAQIHRDPSSLGSWWQRYGLVTNPEWQGASDTQHPQQLVLPNVSSTLHSPTGVINSGFTLDAAGNSVPADGRSGHHAPFSLGGSVYQFSYDGSGIEPFIPGDVWSPPGIVGQTGSQSGGPQADIEDRAFEGGPSGSEVKRQNVFAGFTFDVTDRMSLSIDVLDGIVESNLSDQRGIPHGTAPWYYTIYDNNPFLPDVVRDAMVEEGIAAIHVEKQGQVLGQAGNYDDHEEHHNRYETYQWTFGLDKQLFDKWDLKVTMQRGTTDKLTEISNELRIDKEFLAMDAVAVDPADGHILSAQELAGLTPDPANPGQFLSVPRKQGIVTCDITAHNPTQAELAAVVQGVTVPAVQGARWLASSPDEFVPIPGPIGPDAQAGCTPLNVLGQGNATPQAQQYVVSPKSGLSAVTQEFAEILLNGDIWKGYGPGAFSMAAGATYRKQWFWQNPEPQELMAYGPPLNAPDLGIRGISPGYTGGSPNLHEFSTVPWINGGYDVWEAYSEFNLPLWSSGPRYLEADLAGRYSDYSTSGGVVSWKSGLNFSVAKALRLRGTISRDVREPTFSERYDLQGGGGRIIERSPQYNGQNLEITVTTGGNPDLKPEKADTVTAGFVFQPARVPGFQFSADTFRIDLEDAVDQLGQQAIVDGCYLDNDANLCSLIRLDPTGHVQNVRNVYLNVASAKVRGIDYEVLFNTKPDFVKSQDESLSFRLLAGRLLERSTTTAAGTTTENAGTYTEPDATYLGTVDYQIGSFGITWQQRYIPETMLGNNNTYAQFEPGLVVTGRVITLDDATVQSKSYSNVGFSYRKDMSGGQSLRAQLYVENLFDEDPPIVATFGQRGGSQIVPANYDVFGRQYSLSLDYRF